MKVAFCLLILVLLGGLCETKLQSECEGGYSVPGIGICGPCMCKTEENFNATCDNGNLPNSFPGKCFCKDTFYISQESCVDCNCAPEGSKSLICDRNTGQCKCKPNVIGRQCDVVSDAKRPNKGKFGKRRPKEICGSDGVVYKTKCEFATARKETCDSETPLTIVSCEGDKKKFGGKKRMGHKGMKKMQLCGSDGVTYESKCKLMVEVHCNKLKIVHAGACDDCSKENVCPWAGKLKMKLEGKRDDAMNKLKEIIKKADGDVPKRKGKRFQKLIKKLKRKQEIFVNKLKQFGLKRKHVCASNGEEYDSKCDFNVARCEQFKLDQTILKQKRCPKKPTEDGE